MKNGKAVLFTGGLGPEYNRVAKLLSEAEIKTAADSGWDTAVNMGIKPDYYIGDMDSIKDHRELENLPAGRVIKHPVDKDFTDTELAIKFLSDRQYRDIVLVGGGGGRIDHLMALIGLFNREIKPAEWFTSTEHIIRVDKDCDIECSIGQTVSVFNCGNSEAVVSTDGLKWELDGFTVNPGLFSISNTALKKNVSVKIKSGAVLFILNYN